MYNLHCSDCNLRKDSGNDALRECDPERKQVRIKERRLSNILLPAINIKQKNTVRRNIITDVLSQFMNLYAHSFNKKNSAIHANLKLPIGQLTCK